MIGEGLIGVEEVARALLHQWQAARESHTTRPVAMARAAISAHLEALRAAGWKLIPAEPTEAMWQAWRSVNCKIGEDGMEEFTYFSGDYGNWLACHNRMIAASPPCDTKGETDG